MNVEPKMSTQRATVGRILHCYSDRWVGPRPGMVVAEYATNGWSAVAVNVQFRGGVDGELLALVRGRQDGNTFESVAVYEDLSGDPDTYPAASEALKQALADTAPVAGFKVVACWPPRV